MRSRAVILPRECWRSIAFSEPALSASSLRLASSSRRRSISSPIWTKLAVMSLVPPIEPVPSPWSLPDPADAPEAVGELIGVGADLEPGTLLAAYRRGLFPMPLHDELRSEAVNEGMAPIGWWSPDPRGLLPLDA